jgi:hypothetical protein
MDKDRFINEVTNRLSTLFRASKEGYKIVESERHRLEGFIQAGIFLELVSMDETKGLMGDIHCSVFGKSIEERNRDKAAIWKDAEADYEKYEIPTFQR